MKKINIDRIKVIRETITLLERADIKVGQYIKILKIPDGWFEIPKKEEYGKIVYCRENDFFVDCIGSEGYYLFNYSTLENYKRRDNSDYLIYLIPVTSDEVMVDAL